MSALRRGWLVLAILLVPLAYIACTSAEADESLSGNGRIEGNEVRAAAEIAGRVERLTVHEGDRVEAGDLLVELSRDEIRARVDEAHAGVAAAQAALSTAQARTQTLVHHEATARTDYERYVALYRSGAISGRERDRVENELQEVTGQRLAAQRGVEEARARLQAAIAVETSARTRLDDARVQAPLAGVVLLRLVEVGEVVRPGQPLLVLVDPDDLFLTVYIREQELGKVRIGNPALVTIDAFPQRVFEGKVIEVAERPEFTPRDVHMPDERATLVFGVKISLRNPERFLKPGMPADAEIVWKPRPGDTPASVEEASMEPKGTGRDGTRR